MVLSMAGRGAVELKHTRSGKRIVPTQRAVRAADAAAKHLARGAGDRAAELLLEEAQRVRDAIARAEPGCADAQTLIAIHQNFEARAHAYLATTPAAMRERADALEAAGSEAADLAAALNDEGYGSQGARLRALADDSAHQARRIQEAAANQDVLVAQVLLRLFGDIVDAAVSKRSQTSGIAALLIGSRQRLEDEHANLTAVLEEVELQVVETRVTFHQAWSTLFADQTLGLYTKDFPFTSRNAAASLLRDSALTQSAFMPIFDLSRSFEAALAGSAARSAEQLVELLEASALWAPMVESLACWPLDGEEPGGGLAAVFAKALIEGEMATLAADGVARYAPKQPAVRGRVDDTAVDDGGDIGSWNAVRRQAPDRTAGGSGLFRTLGKDWQHYRNRKGRTLVPPVARKPRSESLALDPRRIDYEVAGISLEELTTKNGGVRPATLPAPMRRLPLDLVVRSTSADRLERDDGVLEVVAMHRIRYIDTPSGLKAIREKVFGVIGGVRHYDAARDAGDDEVPAQVYGRAAYEALTGGDLPILSQL